jgi:hypothetical protein
MERVSQWTGEGGLARVTPRIRFSSEEIEVDLNERGTTLSTPGRGQVSFMHWSAPRHSAHVLTAPFIDGVHGNEVGVTTIYHLDLTPLCIRVVMCFTAVMLMLSGGILSRRSDRERIHVHVSRTVVTAPR